MTAKEKAEELIEKYSQALDWVCIDMGTELENEFKQCALIAVDEIIDTIPMYTGTLNEKWTYWQEVKTEIERL
ncbi:MAG: hypothetical protein ACQ9ET_00100 [Nitrosomonadaceae bacterium]